MDMCADMCTDMRVDMWIDMCTGKLPGSISVTVEPHAAAITAKSRVGFQLTDLTSSASRNTERHRPVDTYIAWLAGWLAGWMDGIGWMAGWLAAWLHGLGWMASWLAGCMDGRTDGRITYRRMDGRTNG